ncbi:glycosyltransferase family 9 protein [Helicobacter suis]|uniref:glycosyltransferase family 9 protein n=1 Tax=Helicobacter suis TaxID=104628 RepID=UPI0013D2E86A|nr:glycosyltransferase family 9 protein [Helicobacter suis]
MEVFLRILFKLWYYLCQLLEKVFFLLSFAMVWALRKIKKPKLRPKTLLLIKLDAIGDYVLFRNFLQPLREAYTGYEITFLCNADFLEIVHAYDRSCVDYIIPVDMRKWYWMYALFYRPKMLYLLNKQGYEIVIVPTYHRFPHRDDYLVRLIHAQHKIGSKGLELTEQWYYKATENLRPCDMAYTTLLDTTPGALFEFERNKEFFGQLLQRPLTEIQLHLRALPANISLSLPMSYGVFFLGASDPRRKWAIASWIALAQKISPAFSIVLCGSKKEVLDALQIIDSVPGTINLAGKTTWIELLHVLSKASFIVSNETAIPHFSVALGLGPVFVISNANTLKRFVPYPEYMNANYHVIYHPKIEILLQTPHGFGRCIEIYSHGRLLDLRIPHPQFPQRVADKMAIVNPDFIKNT